MTGMPIKDETLRLTLSPGHDAWLRRQIRGRYAAIAALLTAAVSAAGLAAASTARRAAGDQGMFGMSPDGVTALVIASCLTAGAATLCALLVLRDVRRYRRWRRDHAGFLRRYNREPD